MTDDPSAGGIARPSPALHTMTMPDDTATFPRLLAEPRIWRPKRVIVTRSAAAAPHTAEILRRCDALGVTDVTVLAGDRITGLGEGSDREVYARAKSTLAVVVAPPSALRPSPIPPSADWRLDLARGCPGHCQYCYLAGSLSRPTGDPGVRQPRRRARAGIPGTHAGSGERDQRDESSGATEGTTFELSCYTDPLGIQAVTGSLSEAIARVGRGDCGEGVGLRFTTKYDDVADLVGLPHGGRTRARFSLNAEAVSRRHEAGTATVPARLGALRALATDGYPVGLVVAPIMPVEGWREGYARLLDQVGEALDGVAGVDLTVELITHRFTPGSSEVLRGWYPKSTLEMDPERRSQKRSKFGGVKHVYDRSTMAELRGWFESAIAARLPEARILYWT